MEIVRLIERCRQGDAEALGELYEVYIHRMRGVCRRYINDKQTIEDVVHDAFVIIFTSFDRLRDPRRAESWMMAIRANRQTKERGISEHATHPKPPKRTEFYQLGIMNCPNCLTERG